MMAVISVTRNGHYGREYEGKDNEEKSPGIASPCIYAQMAGEEEA